MVSEPPWLLSLRLDALLLHVSSLDAALPLLILQQGRKKIFVSNNTDKKDIVSDKCHKLSFYFRLASFSTAAPSAVACAPAPATRFRPRLAFHPRHGRCVRCRACIC